MDPSAFEKLLPSSLYEEFRATVARDERLTSSLSNAIAATVLHWAMERGATHYAHWFHPLTGLTAEKHDAFFDSRKKIEHLAGAEFMQQESDASSFPSGGIRNTFEARGYTAWDSTAPFFVWRGTLCIPTVFISYNGEALDEKTPLLKSMRVLEEAALPLCRLFDSDARSIVPMVGWEQEFFVVDRSLYLARPDLVMTSRTLFGHIPARGQQLEDHYFCPITPRVRSFMREVEEECYRIGIPLRTRHNEVAPAQYEFAPMFEPAHIAMDHNQMLRDVMERIAVKHRFCTLFHEKPFAKFNGNGKHCNWSLFTDKGVNLMSPSGDLKGNMLFMLFFLVMLRAVHRHANLLLSSISSAGNDLRLGGAEAPPAIFSAFIGSDMFQALQTLMKSETMKGMSKDLMLKVDVLHTPNILRHMTDRNRTSPFAFTGNKFELRLVGADMNIAYPMAILHTVMAEELRIFYANYKDRLSSSFDKNKAVLIEAFSHYAKEVQPVIYNQDGYSSDWHKEAKRRKLSVVKHTPQALGNAMDKASLGVLFKHNVLNDREMRARYEVSLVRYVKKVEIEYRTMRDLVFSHIIPSTLTYQSVLLDIMVKQTTLRSSGVVLPPLVSIEKILKELRTSVDALTEAFEQAEGVLSEIGGMSSLEKRADAYAERLRGDIFERIRKEVDRLEQWVDDKHWSMVKYRELLFLR